MKGAAAAVAAVLLGYYYFTKSPVDTDSLRGARVLVTGASSGIGAATAELYARLGASVVVVARRADRLQRVLAALRQASTNTAAGFHAITADLGDVRSAAAIIQEAVSALGGLDILVLNHAMQFKQVDYTADTDVQTLLRNHDRQHDINTRSYVHLSAHAATHLHASRRANIVVIGSTAGRMFFYMARDYVSNKYALDGYYGSLRDELRMRGANISVSYAIIGGVDTEMGQTMSRYRGTEKVYRSMYSGNVADCAAAIVEGALLRRRDIYYIHQTPLRVFVTLFHWLPVDVIDYLNDIMMTSIKD